MAALSAAAVLPRQSSPQAPTARFRTSDVELRITCLSAYTFRFALHPIQDGVVEGIPDDGSLVRADWGPPTRALRGNFAAQTIRCDKLSLEVAPEPLSLSITNSDQRLVQRLEIDRSSGRVSFLTGNSPLLGLGEGGPQFDRRGSKDQMRSGQGGYELRTHGARVPIPWILGTGGWAMFFHAPFGTFDFTGGESKFQPTAEDTRVLDIFFIACDDPATIMAEYSRLTGLPELPPLWSFGYQQSHRTLESREEILAEAKTFRDKKLPCDTLIYLGTGFCPSGWNTENGSFAWNHRVFPDPEKMLAELHSQNFHVALHAVILADRLRGSVHDGCDLVRFDEQQASCYWDAHRRDFAMGVDGWWPDEGDPLDAASCLVRHRMYWEGPQIDRPRERPFALHRNGYAGMQRYGAFLWSGDVYSTWETLKTHVAIGINTALTGIPYWGTDIGGFVPTKDFTAELYLRWFQFGAFCPLFRCHGRCWKLRLPWGWDTGDPGPLEIRNYDGAAIPDASQLHNPHVEPICRKYLELRYRMLPYIYSAVQECSTTGMPIMRALWLHHSDDPNAVARGDEYLWGKQVLVAPVVEPGASSRQLYLPRGGWYDFWTGERVEGGKEITRAVDLETMPLYVRAGAILPLGPIKQHVNEKSELPLSISIYPGHDQSFLLYEDDGTSFNYRKGEWMGLQMAWNDQGRRLRVELAKGSRMILPHSRAMEATVEGKSRQFEFQGQPVEIQL
ncbi:MAG: glycoside hydrolase family 31 protein [Acidobacteria bacterium]|nr:glycoside hydrolase family 31 protein [Acidobacteriota bacterium]